MKTIALLFGSTDSEHGISIMSAGSVFKNFPKDKYNLKPIYIQKDGVWVSGDYTIENFETESFPVEESFYFKFSADQKGLYSEQTQERVEIDGAFLMLHGPVGEGGSIQGLLELANIPFVGSQLTSSALCMDKAFTHQVCEREGIQMIGYQLVHSVENIDFDKITYPVVVKPSREGSSYGISYADNKEDLIKAVDFASEFDSRILIEDYVPGHELSVAVLKTKTTKIVSKPVQATRFNVIADFEEKYLSDVQENLFDLPYAQEVLDRVVKESDFIFELLDCAHLSRIDFFITPDEEIYFNEINTLPGFTEKSLYPMLIEKEGVTYQEMLTLFIEDII